MWFAVVGVAFSGVGATSATEAVHGVVSASTITKSARITTNATLYHINPLAYPAAPVNMDLGDVAGDLFFDIQQILSEFPCHDTLPKPSYCVNKETHGQDIGVTKVVLALSEQSYGPYATCNICVNGTSPLNHSHTCTKGEYVCDCGDACTAAVGYENTTVLSVGYGKACLLHPEGPLRTGVCMHSPPRPVSFKAAGSRRSSKARVSPGASSRSSSASDATATPIPSTRRSSGDCQSALRDAKAAQG